MKTNKSFKNKPVLLLLFIFVLLSFTSCGQKNTCSFCGEVKECKKYEILGVERYICNDCINNPDIVSNNVITEYKAEPVDPYYYTSASASGNEASDASSTDASSSDSNSEVSVSDNSSASANQISAPVSQNLSKSDIVSGLNENLANYGMSITAADGTDNYSVLNSAGADADIKLVFTSSSSGKPKLSIEKGANASSSDYTNTCISGILSYLSSNDVTGTGYNVYNNAIMYGNFTLDGCRFYYMDNSPNNSENNTSLATFDISFQ